MRETHELEDWIYSQLRDTGGMPDDTEAYHEFWHTISNVLVFENMSLVDEKLGAQFNKKVFLAINKSGDKLKIGAFYKHNDGMRSFPVEELALVDFL